MEATARAVAGRAVFLIFDENTSYGESYSFLSNKIHPPENSEQFDVFIGDLDDKAVPSSAEVSVRFAENTVFIEKKHSFKAVFDRCARTVKILVSPVLQKADEFSRAIVASSVLRILASEILRVDGGMLFHGSSVVSSDGAHLFIGESGAGKSTVCAMSGQRQLLADEISIILPGEKKYLAAPSPFISDRTLTGRAEQSFPLASINILQQSAVDERVKISARDAITTVMRSLLHFNPALESHAEALDNILHLLEHTPVFLLRFSLSDQFWKIIDGSSL